MPVRGNTFKIFIGNLSDVTRAGEIRELFEAHGVVVEADVMKNYGFVHMENADDGNAAIAALNNTTVNGKAMVVEASTGARRQRTKIFIGNIHKDSSEQELRNLFAVYGNVVETDILANYGFVHMSDEQESQTAISNLDGYELHGLKLRVQESNSKVRQTPGMGGGDQCYRCGGSGHWSRECPRDSRGGPGGGRGGFRGRGGPPRGGGDWGGPARGGSYHDRMERRGYGGGRYDPYPPPPPMPPSFGRYGDRYYDEDPYGPGRYDPYERMPPPPPDYMRYGRRGNSPPRYPGPAPHPRSFGGGYPDSRY